MSQDNASQAATDTKTVSSVYVPPLQLTQGQAPPIAANGGRPYIALDRNGDAGTTAATEAALMQIASGEGKAVDDLLDNAPPGPIKTKWGVGFRRYAECLEYIQANNIETPEGGLAIPLRYSINERPSYSIVSSNLPWEPNVAPSLVSARKSCEFVCRRCRDLATSNSSNSRWLPN